MAAARPWPLLPPLHPGSGAPEASQPGERILPGPVHPPTRDRQTAVAMAGAVPDRGLPLSATAGGGTLTGGFALRSDLDAL